MKQFFYVLAIGLCAAVSAHAQLLPSVNIGVKAGANLTSFSTNNTLSTDNRAGFLGGFWARIGAGGIHVQPELYYTSKSVKFQNESNGVTSTNTATFKSIDLPVLVGTKIGLFGIGARLNTGPLISFVINQDQSIGDAFTNATRLRYQDQNYAWQFGVGLDIQKVSFDLRYELGLNKIDNGNEKSNVRANLFNLTMAYRLFAF